MWGGCVGVFGFSQFANFSRSRMGSAFRGCRLFLCIVYAVVLCVDCEGRGIWGFWVAVVHLLCYYLNTRKKRGKPRKTKEKKKAWHNFNINKSQVEASTDRAYLIKMPNNSKYAGFKFWHPAKLIRPGRHSAALSLGIEDSFEVRLFKNGHGRYNSHEKIAEATISCADVLAAFAATDANIVRAEH